jgi:hypothetical protein
LALPSASEGRSSTFKCSCSTWAPLSGPATVGKRAANSAESRRRAPAGEERRFAAEVLDAAHASKDGEIRCSGRLRPPSGPAARH